MEIRYQVTGTVGLSRNSFSHIAL